MEQIIITYVNIGIVIMSLMILIYIIIIIKMGIFASKPKREKRICHVTTNDSNEWIRYQKNKCLYSGLTEQYYLIVTEDPECKVDKIEVK
jgi:hypothetical protein